MLTVLRPVLLSCSVCQYWQTGEVERILRDAELHRVEDAQLVARTASKSRLEQYVYGLRTSLEQHAWRSMLTSDEAALIQRQHEACVRWLSAQDSAALRPEDFQRKLDEVQIICQPIILKMSVYFTWILIAPRLCSCRLPDQLRPPTHTHRLSCICCLCVCLLPGMRRVPVATRILLLKLPQSLRLHSTA